MCWKCCATRRRSIAWSRNAAVDAGEFADLFAGPEFTVYPRLFLECDLGRPAALPAADVPAQDTPADLELLPWTPQDYQAAAELIYACYVGHTDAQINDQYRSLHGSLRFLHNIVRFPGCGIFEANFSWMLRDRRSRALVGMILSSRVAPEVAHITQLCVAPHLRGRGSAACCWTAAREACWARI